MNAFFLPDKDYSLIGALGFEFGRAHLREGNNQAFWMGRTVHYVVGALELIPLIGQTISVIEWIVFKIFHCRVKKAIPSEDLEKNTFSKIVCSTEIYKRKNSKICSDTSASLPSGAVSRSLMNPQKKEVELFWPKDLTQLNLSTDEKDLIDQLVKQAFKADCVYTHLKKKVKFTKDSGTVTHDIALSLSWYVLGGQLRCILLPKTTFKSSGERDIRYAYDLTKGQFLLKKRVTGPFEKKIINHMVDFRKKGGGESDVLWRSLQSKNGQEKEQIIEPILFGTPADLINQYFIPFNLRIGMLLDLVKELKELQSISFNAVSCSIGGGKAYFPQYGGFHSDIKLENILIDKSGETLRAEFCDFGLGAASLTGVTSTQGYTSPEYVWASNARKEGKLSQLDYYKLHYQHAQKRDVWSLGLVFLSLLVGRTEVAVWQGSDQKTYQARIAPLLLLKKGLQDSCGSEIFILSLKQQDLDAEVDTLMEEVVGQYANQDKALIEPYFNMVKKMLKLQPNQRLSTEELVEEISHQDPEKLQSMICKEGSSKDLFWKFFETCLLDVEKHVIEQETPLDKRIQVSKQSAKIEDVLAEIGDSFNIPVGQLDHYIFKIKIMKWMNPTRAQEKTHVAGSVQMRAFLSNRECISIVARCNMRCLEEMYSDISKEIQEILLEARSFAVILRVEESSLNKGYYIPRISKDVMRAIPGDFCGDAEGNTLFEDLKKITLTLPEEIEEDNFIVIEKSKLGFIVQGQCCDSAQLDDKNTLVLRRPVEKFSYYSFENPVDSIRTTYSLNKAAN